MLGRLKAMYGLWEHGVVLCCELLYYGNDVWFYLPDV